MFWEVISNAFSFNPQETRISHALSAPDADLYRQTIQRAQLLQWL
jgi:hypothetical protein